MTRVFRSKGLREKEKKIQNRSLNEEKKKRGNDRVRSKTVAFRLTPEEKELLESLVESSGLLKQDYIIQALTNHSVTYVGSPKMARGLNEKLDKLLLELKRLKNIAKDICFSRTKESTNRTLIVYLYISINSLN